MRASRAPSPAMSDPAPARFPKTARVRLPAQYARVFKSGRRQQHAAMSLHRLEGGDGARLGMAVSRKVDPRAVGRNRIKRILRETFRRHRPAMRPGDIVVVLRPMAATLGNAALSALFLELLRRSGALPPTGPTGTMQAAPPPNPSPLAVPPRPESSTPE